jgi:hypothetical protein
VTGGARIPQSRVLLALVVAAVLGFPAGILIGELLSGGGEPAAAAPGPAPTATAAAESPAAGALARFNRAHLEGRVVLANGVTSGEQARAATRLAGDHVATARSIERLGAAPETVALLERLAHGYDRLATAARLRDAGAFREAAGEVRAMERELRAMLGSAPR